MKINSIIKAAASAAAVCAVIAAAGAAFVPSLFTSISNGGEKECYENSKKLLSLLEYKMNGTAENELWYKLVEEKNSTKLLNALNRRMDTPVDISDYYVKFGEDSLMILCKAHPQALDVKMDIPDNLIRMGENYTEPRSKLVTALRADGRDTYFQNAILDSADPSKTVFNDGDDFSALFPDISVTALYAGGGERMLERGEYKMTLGTLDMTKTGSHTIYISYAPENVGQEIFTTFEIDVIPNEDREPLIVDGGAEGKYELASWVWTDYVADALDAPGDFMEFTASIVFDDGEYYYFPDGFIIEKNGAENGSIAGAVDRIYRRRRAYSIKFDTSSRVISGPDDGSEAHEGALRVENGEVYIWQVKRSQEFPRGWLRVYCDMTEITDE